MKIIICGDGKMGKAITQQLADQGHSLTLIDAKYDVLAASIEQYDVMVVEGNCACASVLEQAGVREADMIIAVTSGDEVNLLCCLTAHAMNPRLHTISRIRNPEYTSQLYEMADIFALSITVNPDLQAAAEIERMIKYPGFLKRDTFAKGRAEIVDLRIDSKSKLCNRPLRDMYSIVHCKTLVCAVLRNGRATPPDGSFVLREGDCIFVTAQSSDLTRLLKNLGIITKRGKRVLLCGGSRISYYLAKKLLESGMQVHLIESDHSKCLELAAKLPRATIIHGDASSQSLLLSEDLEAFDSLVSLTGLDEVNIMISLYGHSHGLPQVITKLGHLENSNILNYLPLNTIVNPKELSSSSVVRYIRAINSQSGDAVSVHPIANGQLDALEFQVDETTHFCGVPLRNLKLKHNTLLCCISTGASIEIPNGSSSFQPGDTVVVVADRCRQIERLNDIFEE